jgi:type VI protein secretion system component VasK
MMDLEKRADAEQNPTPQDAVPRGKKPVIIYILILFIAAFLLMALSFFMHQRANTEALGDLKDSVTAMQDAQAAQEKIIALQEELAKVQEEQKNLEDKLESESELAAANLAERDALERRANALLALYQLQQLYSAKDYEGCEKLISDFETGLADSLPKDALDDGVVSPAERYSQLKEAVEAKTGAN